MSKQTKKPLDEELEQEEVLEEETVETEARSRKNRIVTCA